MKKLYALMLAVTLAMAGAGCAGLTLEEAQATLEEIKLTSQAEALEQNCVEISTNFTIGQGVQKALEELRDFIRSQLPCAEVTLSGNKLTITYGALGGNCTYNGHTFSGSHSITVTSNEPGVVQVDHVWTDLSNGVVKLNGNATVTWNANDKSRHVIHTATWTRLADGRQGQGTGDRLQQALPEGIRVGFQVDGDRTWKGERGEWSLDIQGVQMRWIDPVPQAGHYVLQTPFGKNVTVSFERVSDNQIKVTVSGPRRSFSFLVNKAG